VIVANGAAPSPDYEKGCFMFPSVLPMLAFDLNANLDTGKFANVTKDEILEQIEAGTIFDWLGEKLEYVDLSVATEEDKLALVDEWRNFANAIDPKRKFGVENNGLCLLLAYVIEGMQQRLRAGSR